MTPPDPQAHVKLYLAIAGSVGLYLALARRDWSNGWTEVTLFLSIFAALFAITQFVAAHYPKLGLAPLLASALLFRCALLPAGFHDGEWQRFQLYDSDIWRYLWDGHATLNGHNPYQHAPRNTALDALAESPEWSHVRDQINYGDYPTIYPPSAQAVFASVVAISPAGGNVLLMKLAVTLLDLAALAFLLLTLRALKRPLADSIWYAWNPLVIKSFAGSGHIDSLTVAALAATFYAFTRTRTTVASASLAIGILSKWSPVALVPLLARRFSATGLAILAVLVLPALWIPNLFAGAQAFARFWEFNALPHLVLKTLTRSPVISKGICAAIFAGLLLWILRKKTDPGEPDLEFVTRQSGYILGGLIVLSPALMPWYVTWLLPGAILARDRTWIAFSALVFAAFLVMVDGHQRWYAIAFQYAILFWILVRKSRDQTDTTNATDRGGSGAVAGL